MDLADAVTAYAYWVCTAVSQRDADWEESLREYTAIALRRAAYECEAERRELALIRRELQAVRGMVLDVGAGWGRLAPLYDQLGLPAAFARAGRPGNALDAAQRSELGGAWRGGGAAFCRRDVCRRAPRLAAASRRSA